VSNATLQPGPLLKRLHAAFCHDATRHDLLQMAADGIRDAGGPYTSVYLYLLDESGQTLNLGAFSGRVTEHTAIPIGRGLCGRAVATRQDLNVADVNAESEYLACNLDTRSELIVLIRRNEEILGQIDIDSDVPDGFDANEQSAVKEVADGLASLL
jgi:GAF domain-containing protein